MQPWGKQMKRRDLLASAAALIAGPARAAETLILHARDGVAVHATHVVTAAPRQGTILLFHMAGSNLAEYAPIAPELARLGWDSIAIDQRSGGTAFGRANETVRQRGGSTDFGAALPDLEAALEYSVAQQKSGRILVWGSSYSAALVFLLAAAQPQHVQGMLAFSPGEFIRGRDVRAAAATLRCPIFVTSAHDPGEVSAARTLFAAAPATLKRHFVPSQGVHGSSTLRADSNPRGMSENWQAVRAFLDAVAAS